MYYLNPVDQCWNTHGGIAALVNGKSRLQSFQNVCERMRVSLLVRCFRRLLSQLQNPAKSNEKEAQQNVPS